MFEHITPVLVDLHWSHVRQHIKFKVLAYVYKVIHDFAPAYQACSQLFTRGGVHFYPNTDYKGRHKFMRGHIFLIDFRKTPQYFPKQTPGGVTSLHGGVLFIQYRIKVLCTNHCLHIQLFHKIRQN